MSLKYINIIPAECTAMVGDAFNSDKFIRDHIAAFNALKKFEFRIGAISYEHIYSALDEFQEDWRIGPLQKEIDAIFHFCGCIVGLTQSFEKRTGHRIANDATTSYDVTDDGDAKLKDDKSGWGTIASYSDEPPKVGSNFASVRVRATGCYEDTLLIHDNISLWYLPNDAHILAYIRLDKCIVNRSPHVNDSSSSRNTSQTFASRLFDWARPFGDTADPLLTPRMAACIHGTAMIYAEEDIYLK